MHTGLSRIWISRILAVLLLFALLTGCGALPQPTPSSNVTPTSGSTISTSNDSLSPNKTGISIDEGSLHIDASNGIQCPSDFVTQGPPDNPGNFINVLNPANNLVLATNRLTYDSNELQQIKNYLNAVSTDEQASVPIPDTLQYVLGGPTTTDTSRSLYLSGVPNNFIDDCTLVLQITNTSQNPLQIASVGVQLATDTQPNNYQYRLLDICNILSGGSACEFGGGPTPCDQYLAPIKLSAGSTNAIFSTSTLDTEACGELTLNPGDVKNIFIYFYSPQNLIYSLVPQLNVDTASGPNTLTLSALTSTLAFANSNQFTCYGLQNDTFVAESPLPATAECV